ncbi:MAG: hypothetical protein OSB58_04655, partial [Alphaproteobacteria bacterium]|nr:hypothetical protein [Alphaproteobacteria bacterium]
PQVFARHGLHGLQALQAPHLAASRITAFGKAARFVVSNRSDVADTAAAVELSSVNGANTITSGTMTEPNRPVFLFFMSHPNFPTPISYIRNRSHSLPL